MRYLLDDRFALRGWKGHPFCLLYEQQNSAVFLSEAEFQFLLSCDGRQDIDILSQTGELRSFADILINKRIIRLAKDGENREISYYCYPGVYRKTVQWSITGRCNYRCRHCFQSAPDALLGEPSFEQCVHIINELDENGIKRIGLTGGEPLVRPDFLKIVDELVRRKMYIRVIYTNGRLLDRVLLDELTERGVDCGFQFSFDGVGWHDWFRGVPGAEKSVRSAFALVREYHRPFTVTMCVCKENITSIRDTVKLLADAGCTGLKMQIPVRQGNWLSQTEHYLSYKEAYQYYLDYLPQFYEDGCPLNIEMERFFSYDKETNSYRVADIAAFKKEQFGLVPLCDTFCDSLYIGSNGVVLPCMSMSGTTLEKSFPNIFEMPLKEILSDSVYLTVSEKCVDSLLDKNVECHNCPHICSCLGGCRAVAAIDKGNYLAPDLSSCEIFKNGWIEKVCEVADRYFTRSPYRGRIKRD